MKDLIKSFNLYGKITEQHAKDIEEILENYDREVRKETAESVLDLISEEEGWEETKEHYKKQILNNLIS